MAEPMNQGLMTVVREAAERLGKWRTVLTGWQLGTRQKGDPEADAVRDHREVSLMLRAEVNTMLSLLIDKGVFTADDWGKALLVEYEIAQTELESRFPGFKSASYGMNIDPKVAAETTKGWKP